MNTNRSMEGFVISVVAFFIFFGVDESICNPLKPRRATEAEGRLLQIRRFPGVQDYQSDVYEVLLNPYDYKMPIISAKAILKGEGESSIEGEIQFEQQPNGVVHIIGNITGLSPGKHGLNVQRSGDISNGCDNLGGHLNPFMLKHGGPIDGIRHIGDLGNVRANDEGVADIDTMDPHIQLNGLPRGIVGRAVVVTADPDDYGRGGDKDSITDGNSGKPLACGVIVYQN